MQFNNYIWDLYKQSENGRETIYLFEKKDHKGIAARFDTGTYSENLTDEDVQYFQNSELKNLLIGERSIDLTLALTEFFAKYDFDNPRKVLMEIIENEFYLALTNQRFEGRNYDLWLDNLEIFTTALFLEENEFFIPYYYSLKFNILQSIFEYFEIPLPKIPIKKDWLGRLLYYVDLCESLYEFRNHNSLTIAELCAFLYDFAPATIEKNESKEMPKPAKAWFCGGNKAGFYFLDQADHQSVSHWQGSVDTRKGDIIAMYCLAPRSYIHSIWRADCDGFIDPFFYYYSLIYISHPEIVKPIQQKELNENQIISKSPLIRSNMQGLVGYPIKFEEYNELLKILERKGQNIATLPLIEPDFIVNEVELSNEKDVEEKLIEPLLFKLGYSKGDWVRQMPVKMGRGERNYPDYCFGAISKRGEESAKMILEAKFSIRNSKELNDAYFQTKSYALRLQAAKFVISSKEGIWIYEPIKNQYDIKTFTTYSWRQLEHPDVLHVVFKKITHQHFIQK